MNPPQAGLDVVLGNARQLLELLAQHHPLVRQVRDDVVRQHGVHVLDVQLQLGGKLEEVRYQPEKVRRVNLHLLGNRVG